MLSPGDRLGPYEVVSALGAGGMGEVYRARDTRLGRDVALKVLPNAVAGDPDRLKRFEREARALAALEHPNILALHDVALDQGRPYLIFELVEGQTLRQRLGNGPLPARKAVEYAVQACRGLAAAHARGIFHRDLKPENLALTFDGRIKILDFGLARLTEALGPSSGETATAATESGVVLGTAGYMSPEQIRGKTVDARSDLFSLGAVLYEMVSGRPAFDGTTPADRISAVLTGDPPDLNGMTGSTPPPLLAPIVRRCLEKEAEDRFQTARDLAFALEGLALGSNARLEAPGAPRRHRGYVAAGAALAALAVAFTWYQPWLRRAPLPAIEQLTFRRGMILDARFTADGNTVFYGGLFDGLPAETYSLHLGRKESLRLELPPSRLFGVSSAGELAVVLGRHDTRAWSWLGTLASVPLSGGAPRALVDGVFAADWSPDGRELAATRLVDGQYQLEYPLGRVLRRPVTYEDAGFAMRVSPDGSLVAYTSPKGVAIVDRGGRLRELAAAPSSLGLAWDASGRSLWVGLTGAGRQSTGLWRVSLDGTAHEAARFPGVVMVHDVARDGRLLVHTGFERGGVRATAPADGLERDLCSLSWCQHPSLADDGSQLALWDWTVNPSPPLQGGWCYWRSTSGGPPARLGEGEPLAVSPDGHWVLVVRTSSSGLKALELLPTGSGALRRLNSDGLVRFLHASISDANVAFVVADDVASQRRTFRIGEGQAQPTPVTPEGVSGIGGPVNDRLLASRGDGTLAWYPLNGGDPLLVGATRQPGTNLAGLSADGRFLFEGEFGAPGRIHRLDLKTRQRTLWRTVAPDDSVGFVGAYNFTVARDGRTYAYAYLRLLQDLYLVDGLR